MAGQHTTTTPGHLAAWIWLATTAYVSFVDGNSTPITSTPHYTVEGRLVERQYNSTGHLYQCQVYGDRRLAESALQLIPRESQFLVDDGHFQGMVKECSDIDLFGERHIRKKRVIQLIYPGTLWCGQGDIANSFHDVGRRQNTDVCCRNHDLCPISIRPGETQFNLTNRAVGTVSSCTCDREFYDCLKAVDSPSSRSIGNIFFNAIRLPCVEESHPETCTGWWLWKRCRKIKTQQRRLNIIQSHFTF